MLLGHFLTSSYLFCADVFIAKCEVLDKCDAIFCFVVSVFGRFSGLTLALAYSSPSILILTGSLIWLHAEL